MFRIRGSVITLFVLCCLLVSVCRAETMLSLAEAIRQAQDGPQAREKQDLVDAGRGMVTQAGLWPDPKLYLQSEDLRPWSNSFSFLNASEDYGYIGQMFETGGKRGRRLDVARANLHQAEAERAVFRQQIAGRVSGAYWMAVVNAGIFSLLEDDMKAVDQIVHYNKERVDAGAMRGVDLLRAEIERDRLVLQLEAARRDAVLGRIELFRQMGRTWDPQVRLSDELNSMVPIQTQTLEAALTARADVMAAKEAILVAEADVKLQRSLAVPDVDVLAGYKRNAGADTLYTSLQVNLPFRNRNQGEIERAQANVRVAQDRLRQIELLVKADVDAAEESYARQREVVQNILPDMRARTKRNLSIMDDAYRSGGVDLLRYLDAARAAFEVEANSLRTLAEFRQAGLRLQIAYGAMQ